MTVVGYARVSADHQSLQAGRQSLQQRVQRRPHHAAVDHHGRPLLHDVNRNPVSGSVPYDTTATIGRTDSADTNGYVISVLAAYQFPSKDIAVARLATPAYGIRPLGLSTVAPKTGEILRITGWGALDDANPVPATHLQAGQVRVVTVDSTTVGVVGYRPEPITSACLDDSGAPYFAELRPGVARLVSIESTGPGCPHNQVETTSRVNNLIFSWLRSTIHVTG